MILRDCNLSKNVSMLFHIEMLRLLIWFEANRGSMQDVLLSLLQFVGIEDTYEVYIDGCDNYQFDNFDGAYIFAKKRKKNRKNDTMSNESSHALLGEHLSALPKDILST